VLTTVLEVAGVVLLCAALVLLLGVAGALAAAGGVSLLVAWLIERRS